MFHAGEMLKKLRERRMLSQRKFAQQAQISFRQIQRLEMNQSDITLGKLNKLLKQFYLELKIVAQEPHWNVLYHWGLPLHVDDARKQKYSYKETMEQLKWAAHFLVENKHHVAYRRHWDSFKALLLALKTHYPSRFKQCERYSKINFSNVFNLDVIEGRHIKLRNICLFSLSRYFRQ